MIRKLFNLTPLGRADNKIKSFLEKSLEENEFEHYNRALNKYRNAKILQQFFRLLLYTSVVTSVAATFNLDLGIINKIASYFGFTLTLILYIVTSYFTILYREDYHVQRDILISTSAEQKLKQSIQKGEIKMPERPE
jgi:hypothetical protein